MGNLIEFYTSLKAICIYPYDFLAPLLESNLRFINRLIGQ